MQDGIIKGTGNSRYLRSITNFLTQYPTYQDFVAALVAGTLPIDLNGINPTGWDQLGSALNKENLLSDESASQAGFGTDAVPDDMWACLVPVGGILWHASQTIPARFLLCDGSAVSRTDYAALFAVIGTTFGAGDGSTTFALPDLRAAFIRGAGTNSGYSATFAGKQVATSLSLSPGISTNLPNRIRSVSGYDKTSTTSYSRTNGEYSAGSAAPQSGEVYYTRPYNVALTPVIKY